MTDDVLAGVAQTFTAHNILLDDGTQTLPGRALAEEDESCQLALRCLDGAFGQQRRHVRVADLGCLEGGHSVAFARAGYAVTGIERRPENFACCQHVAHRVTTQGLLAFQKADVRNAASRADVNEWDAVFCGGLLYHLDYPATFLNILGRGTGRVLIVDTHVATDADTAHEGHYGRWHDEDTRHRWAAWRNERSFWLSEQDLMAAMTDAGFSPVQKLASTAPDRGVYAGWKLRRH